MINWFMMIIACMHVGGAMWAFAHSGWKMGIVLGCYAVAAFFFALLKVS